MAEKLKQEGRAELNQAELTEELEDEEGNVYNRKVSLPPPYDAKRSTDQAIACPQTYEDLKRQGLV